MSYPLPKVSFDLQGHAALVTGASSGLGLRFAKVPAAAGVKVAMAARRLDRLETPASEIAAAGSRAAAIAMDATDAGQLIAAVGAAEATLRRETLFINNAGIVKPQEPGRGRRH